jgi:hypothetical protein
MEAGWEPSLTVRGAHAPPRGGLSAAGFAGKAQKHPWLSRCGESNHGIHAPMKRVCHARGSRWQWSERRPSVESGDAIKPVGEVCIL